MDDKISALVVELQAAVNEINRLAASSVEAEAVSRQLREDLYQAEDRVQELKRELMAAMGYAQVMER